MNITYKNKIEQKATNCSYLENNVFCKYKAHCPNCLAASAKLSKLLRSQQLYISTVFAKELRAA
jgi:hypothetical protein